jgi:hypothetical protein
MDHLTDTNHAAAADIARKLGESNPQAVIQIERIVNHLGLETAQTALKEALAVEAEGGMLTDDEKRRRTPGGVFFYLVRGRTPPELRPVIWPAHRPAGQKGRKPAAVFPWETRAKILAELIAKPGDGTVKMTIIGRPSKIIERGDVVLMTIASAKAPSLPKGLPTPPADPTVYVVYVARKQWNKVAEAMQDVDDKLIVEGYPFIDKKLGVVAVLAQQATTAKLQRAKRPASAEEEAEVEEEQEVISDQ